MGGNTLLAPGWPRFPPSLWPLLDWRSHFCFPALLAIGPLHTMRESGSPGDSVLGLRTLRTKSACVTVLFAGRRKSTPPTPSINIDTVTWQPQGHQALTVFQWFLRPLLRGYPHTHPNVSPEKECLFTQMISACFQVCSDFKPMGNMQPISARASDQPDVE